MLLLRLARFFRALAGGTPCLDRPEVHQGTRNLYTGIGVFMTVSVVVSALAATFTWGSILHGMIAGVLCGVVWFFISMSLNYLIAWKLDHSHHGSALSRTVAASIAFSIGLVVAQLNAAFVLMWMFAPEITQWIEGKYRAERAVFEIQLTTADLAYSETLGKRRSEANTEVTVVNVESRTELAKLEAEVLKLRNDYRAALAAVTVEVEGRAQSRQAGEGSRARQKRDEAARVKELLDVAVKRLEEVTAASSAPVASRVEEAQQSLKRDEVRLQSDHDAAQKRIKDKITELDNTPRDGFLHRYEALQHVAAAHWVMAWSLFAIFCLIESATVFAKLFSGKTDYHYLRAAEMAEKMKGYQERELTAVKESMKRSEALRAAFREEKQAQLDDAKQHRGMVTSHLEELKAKGASEEDLKIEEKRLMRTRVRRVA